MSYTFAAVEDKVKLLNKNSIKFCTENESRFSEMFSLKLKHSCSQTEVSVLNISMTTRQSNSWFEFGLISIRIFFLSCFVFVLLYCCFAGVLFCFSILHFHRLVRFFYSVGISGLNLPQNAILAVVFLL